MSEWVFLRQIRIQTKDQVIYQPYVSVWWTLDESQLILDISHTEATPEILFSRPVLITIPLTEIKKITIWIHQGKEELEKHVILDQNQDPELKTPIIRF